MTLARPPRAPRRAPADLSFTPDPALVEAFAAEEPDWLAADRRAALALFDDLPAETNQLYTPYIDLRSADLEDVRRLRPDRERAGRCEVDASWPAGVAVTPLRDWSRGPRLRRRAPADDRRAAARRRQARPADPRRVEPGRRDPGRARRPARPPHRRAMARRRAWPRAADADDHRARGGREGVGRRGPLGGRFRGRRRRRCSRHRRRSSWARARSSRSRASRTCRRTRSRSSTVTRRSARPRSSTGPSPSSAGGSSGAGSTTSSSATGARSSRSRSCSAPRSSCST